MANRKEAFFIGEDAFKALAPISGDLDWEYIWPNLLAVQDERIQPLLGQKLYEKIMELIDSAPLADPYKTLVEDYIARTLVWMTCGVSFIFWGIKVVNSGVMQRVVDDGQPLLLTDIDKVAARAYEQGEFYAKRLTAYLCAHTSDFPEYTQCEPGEMPASAANYDDNFDLTPYTKLKKK